MYAVIYQIIIILGQLHLIGWVSLLLLLKNKLNCYIYVVFPPKFLTNGYCSSNLGIVTCMINNIGSMTLCYPINILFCTHD